MSKVKRIESRKPARIAEIVERHNGEQVLIWVQYDEEGDILHNIIPNSVHLSGKTKQKDRLDIIEQFRKGQIRTVISKPSLLGTGLNLQHLHVCIFSWSSDSWRDFYQAIGRLQRYGQKEQVRIYIPHTDLEKPMLDNVMRKEREYLEDSAFQEQLYIESLLDDLKAFAAKELDVSQDDHVSIPDIIGDGYHIINGDCIRIMAGMPENRFDMAVFSPPFSSLYCYTDKTEDMGNCNALDDEFEMHFQFFAHHLYRVMKPGCVVAMHVAPLAILKSVKGYTGIHDFPSDCRAIFESVGFIYDGKTTIRKNPQAQAIRTKAHGLLFKTLKTNSRKNRFCIPDYLMKFYKPGDAPEIKNTWISNEDWIRFADAVWDWVDESDTLNAQTKQLSEGDTRHIAPLQLSVIDACVRLWSAPGEHVLSPFCGIGSEGVISVRHGRRFTGIELKDSYFIAAGKNIELEARNKVQQLGMWTEIKK